MEKERFDISDIMVKFGIMPDNAFSTGCILCVLAMVWFTMAFFTGRNRISFSVYLYIIIGTCPFIGGTACLVYAFTESLGVERLKVAAVFAGFVVVASVVIITGNAIKSRSRKNYGIEYDKFEEEKEDEYKYNDQGEGFE